MKLGTFAKVAAVLIIICVAPFPPILHARGRKTPPVSEILTWISSHFQVLKIKNGKWTHRTVYSMTFHGCRVTVDRNTVVTPSIGKFTREDETTGPFQLSNLRPDKIVVVKVGSNTSDYEYQLNLPSVNPVSDSEILHGTRQFAIYFATKDMADRQAKAWRDAVVACGGKAVPDHLY